MGRFSLLVRLGLATLSVGLASCPLRDGQARAGAAAAPLARGGLSAVGESARLLLAGFDPLEGATPGAWPEPLPAHLEALEQSGVRTPKLDPDRALAATAAETLVLAEPTWRAKKLGYLRAGAVIERDPEAVSTRGCDGGWYRIRPEGYVCVGKTATLDLDDVVVQAARRRADREADLPYVYGRSRYPTPPLYTKVPTPTEQARVELDLRGHARRVATDWDAISLDPIPAYLLGGRSAPSLNGYVHSAGSVYTQRAVAESGFAFLQFFEAEGRKFGVTTGLQVLPLDRLDRVVSSSFRGLELSEEIPLPVVFVRSRDAWLFERTAAGALRAARRLASREAVPITGETVRVGGNSYLVTRSGQLLRDRRLIRVDPPRNVPGWATPGRTWIDVSILRQTLVAYEGARPVYVTLVSTGVDGLGDPAETHSTVRGRFLIHTKHVTAHMSGDDAGDVFDLRDVPYVQYFTEGYALHAAYWHDGFGAPRSHGCINLSPLDARWLFGWTDPQVPPDWHGAMSLHDGTLVNVHP